MCILQLPQCLHPLTTSTAEHHFHIHIRYPGVGHTRWAPPSSQQTACAVLGFLSRLFSSLPRTSVPASFHARGPSAP
jgi:hypothetical protein